MLDGVGHMFWWEQPERSAALIREHALAAAPRSPGAPRPTGQVGPWQRGRTRSSVAVGVTPTHGRHRDSHRPDHRPGRVDRPRLAARAGRGRRAAARALRACCARPSRLTGGQEVKNIGDGLMVVFPRRGSAVECAVAMQQRVERRNRGADEQLAIRDRGRARRRHLRGRRLLRDAGHRGGPALRPGGRAVRSWPPSSCAMVGGRDGTRSTLWARWQLRGLPEPVAAYEVGWEPAGGMERHAAAPAAAARRAHAVGYVGRTLERGRTRELLGGGAARGSARRCSCPASRGSARRASRPTPRSSSMARARWSLFGHCERGARRCLRPWIQALSPPGRARARRGSGGARRAPRRRAGRLVPALGRRLPERAATRQTRPRDRALPALLGGRRACSSRPSAERRWCWCSTTSTGRTGRRCALLEHVVAETHGMRLLVLGTYRDTDLVARPPARRRARRPAPRGGRRAAGARRAGARTTWSR